MLDGFLFLSVRRDDDVATRRTNEEFKISKAESFPMVGTPMPYKRYIMDAAKRRV
jgi:hypothetical protein